MILPGVRLALKAKGPGSDVGAFLHGASPEEFAGPAGGQPALARQSGRH